MKTGKYPADSKNWMSLCPYLLEGMHGINVTHVDLFAHLQNLHRMKIIRKVRLLIL